MKLFLFTVVSTTFLFFSSSLQASIKSPDRVADSGTENFWDTYSPPKATGAGSSTRKPKHPSRPPSLITLASPPRNRAATAPQALAASTIPSSHRPRSAARTAVARPRGLKTLSGIPMTIIQTFLGEEAISDMGRFASSSKTTQALANSTAGWNLEKKRQEHFYKVFLREAKLNGMRARAAALPEEAGIVYNLLRKEELPRTALIYTELYPKHLTKSPIFKKMQRHHYPMWQSFHTALHYNPVLLQTSTYKKLRRKGFRVLDALNITKTENQAALRKLKSS